MQKSSSLAFKFSDLFSKNYRIITTVLLLFPLLIYWQVWDFELVWDDDKLIGHLSNPFVVNPSFANFFGLFSEQFFGMYIPITYSLWGGLKAFADFLSLPVSSVLHSANVFIHIINGLLVFVILKNFVAGKWAVLLGTLFFLLHPLQVEVVAWISEFRNLLAFFFSLSALYFYLKNQTKLNKNSLNFLPLFLFALALLSKPSAVVLPLIIFAINHFHYNFELKNNIKKVLPFAILALIIAIIMVNVQSLELHNNFTIPYPQRPIAWLDSIAFYLYKLFYPLNLAAIYGLDAKFFTQQWWFYPLAILPLGLGFLLWHWRKTQPLLAFSSVLFLIGFLPTSGLLDFTFQQYSLVADRYLYFAFIGISLGVAVVAEKKNWMIILAIILLIFASISALRQIPVWQNGEKLWLHSGDYEAVLRYSPVGLGTHFNNKGREDFLAGEYQKAAIKFDKAIKYYAKYTDRRLKLALENRKMTAEALDKTAANRLLNLNNKATNLIAKGELKLALKTINQALEIYAKQAKTDGNIISEIYYNQGRIYLRQQQAKLAENAFTKAINLGIKIENQQEYSDFFYNRGVAKAQQNLLPAAIDDFAKTIELNPQNAKVRNDKIYSHLLLKQCQKAQADANLARQNQIKLQAEILAKLKQQCPNLSF